MMERGSQRLLAQQINYYECKMEYDKSLSNTNKERDIDMGQNMKEINQNINYGKETIKLVLQFPDEEQDTILIQKEIRTILITKLQEQIKDFFSYESKRSNCR